MSEYHPSPQMRKVLQKFAWKEVGLLVCVCVSVWTVKARRPYVETPLKE